MTSSPFPRDEFPRFPLPSRYYDEDGELVYRRTDIPEDDDE